MVSARILIEGQKIQEIASAVKGIDEKLSNLTERFDIFGESAKAIDNRLAGIDQKLEALPTRIAEAINRRNKEEATTTIVTRPHSCHQAATQKTTT